MIVVAIRHDFQIHCTADGATQKIAGHQVLLALDDDSRFHFGVFVPGLLDSAHLGLLRVPANLAFTYENAHESQSEHMSILVLSSSRTSDGAALARFVGRVENPHPEVYKEACKARRSGTHIARALPVERLRCSEFS